MLMTKCQVAKAFSLIKRAREVALDRIGRTPRERLAWVVSLAEKAPKDFLPGDWENLRLELAVFCSYGPSGFYEAGLAARGGEIVRPSVEEAKQLHTMLGEMILLAIQRKRIPLGSVTREPVVSWDNRGKRFLWAEVPYRKGWSLRAKEVLAALLVDFGHLVKECPAPAPRGQEGEACGTWFVAGRPNQDYCTPQCRSRATTRMYRGRKREKKGGR